MVGADFVGLYLCSFIFGVLLAVFYDLLWVIRVSLFGKKLVWITDVITVSIAGFMISVAQYNFSSGKFRVLPFVFLPLGALSVRLTFSKLLRISVERIINIIHKNIFNIKICVKSYLYKKYILLSFVKGLNM